MLRRVTPDHSVHLALKNAGRSGDARHSFGVAIGMVALRDRKGRGAGVGHANLLCHATIQVCGMLS